jgi:hypothetical protein
VELGPELNSDLKARGWNEKHVRRLPVDLGEVKRVYHVIGSLAEHESIRPIDVVDNGFNPFPKEKALALLPTRQVITIRYRPPEAPVKYVFASITDADGRERCPAQDDTSVQSIKMRLTVLCGRNNFLPNTLVIKFGDLELPDDNRIMSYGIPADSLIDITMPPMEKFYVFDLQENPTEYFFVASDTASTLRAFLAFHRFPDTQNLVISTKGTEPEPSQLLKDLRIRELQLTNRLLSLMVQVSATKKHSSLVATAQWLNSLRSWRAPSASTRGRST